MRPRRPAWQVCHDVSDVFRPLVRSDVPNAAKVFEVSKSLKLSKLSVVPEVSEVSAVSAVSVASAASQDAKGAAQARWALP